MFLWTVFFFFFVNLIGLLISLVKIGSEILMGYTHTFYLTQNKKDNNQWMIVYPSNEKSHLIRMQF